MTTERYTQPCNYSKATMWIVGLALTLGIFVYGMQASRLESVERRVSVMETRLAEIATDVRWVREAMQRNGPRP